MTRSPEKAEGLRAAGAEPAVADGLDRAAVIEAVRRAKPEVVIHQMTALTGVKRFKKFDQEFALVGCTSTSPECLSSIAGDIHATKFIYGTVSRIDLKTRKVTATIEVGVPGTGGELAFGAGHVWATVFQIPLSEIDPATNQVVRVGHGSVWLSNLREQNVWRIDLKGL